MEKTTTLEISWGSLWRVLIFAAVVFALYLSIDILVAVFFAIIISSGLNPFVTLLERVKVPRVLGTILVFIFILGAFSAIIYAVTPVVIDQVNALLEQFFPLFADVFGLDTHRFSNIFELSVERFMGLTSFGQGGQILEFSQSVIGNATLFLAVIAIAFYLLVDNRGVERFLKAILPEQNEDPVTNIFLRARKKVGYWLQAQILLSFFVGLLVFLSLLIIGVPHALLIGILAGFFEIIPFVGPVFTGTIGVLIALSESTTLGLYALILFVVIQQLENNILIPVFMRKAVGLHPVAILVSLLVGANLFGFVGLILAVPATVIMQEFIDDWSARKKSARDGLAASVGGKPR